jgi:hypothetical protein
MMCFHCSIGIMGVYMKTAEMLMNLIYGLETDRLVSVYFIE